MNANQLSTIDEAKAIAAKLGGIGGGVSDIYIPEFVGPYATPGNGDAKFYHLRFHNGAEGFNAGLIRTTMQFFPSRWPLMISTEVNTSANWASNL